jgi:hypothetical protein
MTINNATPLALMARIMSLLLAAAAYFNTPPADAPCLIISAGTKFIAPLTPLNIPMTEMTSKLNCNHRLPAAAGPPDFDDVVTHYYPLERAVSPQLRSLRY